MNTISEAILTLTSEIVQRQKAIEALRTLTEARPAALERRAVKRTRGRKTKRTMSAEGRARIAAAQKARWAKQRKQRKAA